MCWDPAAASRHPRHDSGHEPATPDIVFLTIADVPCGCKFEHFRDCGEPKGQFWDLWNPRQQHSDTISCCPADPAVAPLQHLISGGSEAATARIIFSGCSHSCSQKIHNLQCGILAANKDAAYVLCLDDDIQLPPSFLQRAVACMQADKSAFMLTGQLQQLGVVSQKHSSQPLHTGDAGRVRHVTCSGMRPAFTVLVHTVRGWLAAAAVSTMTCSTCTIL